MQQTIPPDIRDALLAFAQDHGRRWRHQLWLMWLNGKDEGALRCARNIIGPSALRRLKLT